jgi:hypothetical protein
MPDHLLSSLMRQHGVPILVMTVLVALVAYPLLIHVTLGWQRKADDVLLSLSPKSTALYFRAFQNRILVEDIDDPEAEAELNECAKQFVKFYHQWFGRRYLIFPVLIILTIAALLSFALGETGFLILARRNGWNFESRDYLTLPKIAAAAVAGAYAFVASDLILRVARRNLTAADILGSTVRLVIAIPLGYCFGALLKDDLSLFIAFAAGAFPLQAIQTMLQRLANKQLGVELGAGASNDQVTVLSGVDREIADRLEVADITTVAQLAYCDPVQTCIRTNLNFAFVSDIAAQGLAWIYFGDKLDKLRPIGLRGAVEIRNLTQVLFGAPMVVASTEAKARAEAFAKKAATAAGMSRKEFLHAAGEIANDPYTVFLANTWTLN